MSTAARPALELRMNHRSRLAPWAIAGSDIFALEAAFFLGFALRRVLASWLTASIGPEQYLAVALGILLLPIINYQLGLYPGYLLGPVERLRRRTLATLAVFGVLLAWDNLIARGILSRGILLATFVFALVLPALGETLTRAALIRGNRWGMSVIMLGAGQTGRALAQSFKTDPELGLIPIAFLDNRPDTWNAVTEGLPVVGPLGLAPDFLDRAEAAIIALNDLRKEDLPLVQDLNFPRIIVVPDLANLATLWVSARDLGGCLGLEVKKNLLIARNHVLKRCMDRAVALPLIVLSLPILLISALWIKLSSRGPVFYRQIREGLGGRRLSVWKLRTMHTASEHLLQRWLNDHPDDREHWQRYFKLRRDPRVIPGIGYLLRRTSLDELPQLWSVLRGEMSLVGPRPFPNYHLEQFNADFRAFRARVLPGLTGLWQVSARSDGDLIVQESLDTYYIRNWSPWLDLYILARTVKVVLMGDGAY
jgi:Undecaprenyl-phosphate galactose phosphotransferase WbaP